MGRFDGRVVLITGAARGQGRSHALRFAAEGADVIALDICGQVQSVRYPLATVSDLEETAKEVEALGRGVVARQADVRDPDALQAVVDEGLAEFGRLDFVLANAGILSLIGEESRSRQSWIDSIDVMLTGVFNTVEATVPSMIEAGRGGSIVLTSSTAGLRSLFKSRATGTAGALGYTAAKHGVVGLMRVYASSLAEYRIRVNTVHPAGVNSPMIRNEAWAAWAQRPEFQGSHLANPLPIEALEPSDISEAMVYLCSDEARAVTGTTLPVDAGFING